MDTWLLRVVCLHGWLVCWLVACLVTYLLGYQIEPCRIVLSCFDYVWLAIPIPCDGVISCDEYIIFIFNQTGLSCVSTVARTTFGMLIGCKRLGRWLLNCLLATSYRATNYLILGWLIVPMLVVWFLGWYCLTGYLSRYLLGSLVDWRVRNWQRLVTVGMVAAGFEN